jgi:hypothetical protein
METLQQIICALYVALGEAAGGPRALHVANRVLRDAIADGVVSDPFAIEVLESLAHDEDDSPHALDGDLFEALALATQH